jgi:hypothetical protein
LISLAVQSDLHIDHEGNGYPKPPPVEADVLFMIGDTTNAMTRSLHWIAENFRNSVRRCVYVPGNHDFYRGGRGSGEENTFYEDQMARGREIARALGIDLLQNDVLHLDDMGVRIAGATLWSDFSLLPRGWSTKMAMYYSQNGKLRDEDRWSRRDKHNDFVEIRVGKGNSDHRFTPSQWLQMHFESFGFFKRTLETPFDGETICVSHMGPASSVDVFGMHSWLYGSRDIEELMAGPHAPCVWLHGHVHKSLDYTIGQTRVVCNPRGYALANGTRENPQFDPTLIVQIEPRASVAMRI